MKRALLFLLPLLVAAQPPLRLEKTISLAGVQGRIDHLAADLPHQRLFVAALSNGTVVVIDVKASRRIHTIKGLQEPQGILYLAANNRLYVATGGDGACRIYDASDYRLLKTVALGEDADNVRYDADTRRVYVGYGAGALAALDEDGNKLANIPLDAHPESFRLEKPGSRIFVNLPDSKKIGVVDRAKGSLISSWNVHGSEANFPMALDDSSRRLFIVYRRPAEVQVLDSTNGSLISRLPTVGDADDVFYDAARRRVYITGGDGAIAILEPQDASRYHEIARIPTTKGARTALHVPEWNTLFLAVRAEAGQPAAIGVYRAAP